jgi:hypothetical protein
MGGEFCGFSSDYSRAMQDTTCGFKLAPSYSLKYLAHASYHLAMSSEKP